MDPSPVDLLLDDLALALVVVIDEQGQYVLQSPITVICDFALQFEDRLEVYFELDCDFVERLGLEEVENNAAFDDIFHLLVRLSLLHGVLGARDTHLSMPRVFQLIDNGFRHTCAFCDASDDFRRAEAS